ncbi:hypothetical protein ACSSVY_001011 [Roseovarius sp. MBR-51]
MPRTDTKQQRRRFRKLVDETARQLARHFRDYNENGDLVAVNHPKAQAVLERGFSRLLQSQFTPQVLKLSRAEGLAFPRQKPSEIPQSATPWIAVGADKSSYATYVLRWFEVSTGNSSADRAIAESVMFSELYKHLQFSGFPVGGDA